MTIDKIKILKINRHLFDNGTSKLNRVLRSLVPRGSTPRLLQMQSVVTLSLYADKEKVKKQREILNLNLSLQNKGYRLDSLAKLKMFSLSLVFFTFYYFQTS
ncbi:MAG: hypothetical protein IPQ10_04275 [Saprospiraceae bacterium]|nr:hypothetical protein [Saprospiraceae bacterium]